MKKKKALNHWFLCSKRKVDKRKDWRAGERDTAYFTESLIRYAKDFILSALGIH